MESSRLYIDIAMPALGALKTSRSITVPSSPTNFIDSVPLPGNLKSVARYWSPKAWRPMMIGLVQPGTRRGTLLADDGFAEHDAAEDVADGAVRRLPHFLQAEFLHPGFVRGDGGAFDADADLLDGVGGVDGDLVVGGVAVFHSEVKIHQLDIEEGVDQLVLDVLPDDPGHLVAIEFDDGVGHLDFCHDGAGLFSENRAVGRDGVD